MPAQITPPRTDTAPDTLVTLHQDMPRREAPSTRETLPAFGPLEAPASRGSLPGAGEALRSEPQGRSFPVLHTVEAGESYWKIAQKYYGADKGKLHGFISSYNGGAKLLAGMKIKVPAMPAAAAVPAEATGATAPPEATPGTAVASGPPRASRGVVSSDGQYDYYVVQKGDTLSGIARRFYGNPTRLGPLEAANRHLRFETLREGMKIRIPKQGTAAFSRD